MCVQGRARAAPGSRWEPALGTGLRVLESSVGSRANEVLIGSEVVPLPRACEVTRSEGSRRGTGCGHSGRPGPLGKLLPRDQARVRAGVTGQRSHVSARGRAGPRHSEVIVRSGSSSSPRRVPGGESEGWTGTGSESEPWTGKVALQLCFPGPAVTSRGRPLPRGRGVRPSSEPPEDGLCLRPQRCHGCCSPRCPLSQGLASRLWPS